MLRHSGRTLYAGAGAGAYADSKNNSTREDADAVLVSDVEEDANMGMVNNAYYVCVGFVTSAGEAQSTQLIKVRTSV